MQHWLFPDIFYKMENFSYERVQGVVYSNNDTKVSWKYYYRQLLVCSVAWFGYLLFGICMGAPTVYIPQIRKEANSSNVIDYSMETFIFNIFSYAGVIGNIILPTMAAYYGRKVPYVLTTIIFPIGAIIFYASTSITQIIVGQALESIWLSGTITLSPMIFTECVTPEYRGFFFTIGAASFAWGIWISNAIGTFFHWRNIGLVLIVLSIYPIAAVFFCPESPLWLARKGQLDKCAEVHRWLRGTDKESELELQRLISNSSQEKDTTSISDILKLLTQKQYYKAIFLSMCTLFVYVLSGKIACGFYSLVIIQKITSSERYSYIGMLILDGVTVLAMYFGAVLSKYLKRRTLFFYSVYVGIASLFALSLYVYLVSLSIFQEDQYVSITLLCIYSLSIGCGPALMGGSLFAELLPLQSRSFTISLMSSIEILGTALVNKLTSMFIRNYGVHVAFLFYGISCSILVAVLYLYLPETKDKSMHEIEESLRGGKTTDKV